MSKCPRCNNNVNAAGKIKIHGPGGKDRLVIIYYCKLCGWRGT
jgi:hypothetical protein